MAVTVRTRLKQLQAFVLSRRCISVLKGSLTFTIYVMLPLISGFESLSAVPAAYSAGVILSIVTFPGKSTGENVSAVFTALLGVALGAANFAILSKLHSSLVAQAIVFAIMVYGIAILKASDPRLFTFALLAILMTFNGVVNSIASDGFVPAILESNFKAYLWAGAVSLTVNSLVFPISSERELRQSLVSSLDHIGTFAHLLAKTHTMALTPEDRALRDKLNQTIRQDFGLVSQKVSAAAFEINISRWSIADYRTLISQIRTMQLSLIALYSSLATSEKTSVPLFREHFLPSTIHRFHQLRRDIHWTIYDIQAELGCKGIDIIETTNADKVYFDLEKQAPEDATPKEHGRIDPPNLHADLNASELENFLQAGARLLREAEAGAPLPSDSDPSIVASGPGTALSQQLSHTSDESHNLARTPEQHKRRGCARRMKEHFKHWEASQKEILIDAIVDGKLTGKNAPGHLRVNEPRPSVREQYGPDSVIHHLRRTNSKIQTALRETSTTFEDDASQVSSNQSLMRVFSVIFALEQFTTVLSECHALVGKRDSKGRKRHRRLRIRFLERFMARKTPTPPSSGVAENEKAQDSESSPTEYPASLDHELSMREALALLEGRAYTPTSPTIWQRIERLEQWTRSPISIYAFKVMGASLVFGALLWAEGSRAFFLKYQMTTSLLTVVVALTPTLGQSFESFVLQVAGSGIGYVVAVIILEIFKNVGGHVFNPYGVVCLVGLCSIPMCYVLYLKPKLFLAALLSLNSCGTLTITEYIAEAHNHNFSARPPLYMGRQLAGLAIALAIVIAFQIFILRNPARRTLRIALAKLVYSNLRYYNVLMALDRGTMSKDFVPPQAAVEHVLAEQTRREMSIQGSILAAMPLVGFAKDEPQLAKPFEASAITRIIHANQLILDRQTEARIALGSAPFSAEMIHEFVSPLFPYRNRNSRVVKARLSFAAASLMSRTPLPPPDPNHQDWLMNITHDALVQSQIFARTPAGVRSIRSGEFTRYWFFLLTISSLPEQISIIEDGCRTLFGSIEDDDPRLR